MHWVAYRIPPCLLQLGQHLWVFGGTKKQLGPLYQAKLYGKPVAVRASSFRGGPFDGFRVEEYQCALHHRLPLGSPRFGT